MFVTNATVATGTREDGTSTAYAQEAPAGHPDAAVITFSGIEWLAQTATRTLRIASGRELRCGCPGTGAMDAYHDCDPYAGYEGLEDVDAHLACGHCGGRHHFLADVRRCADTHLEDLVAATLAWAADTAQAIGRDVDPEAFFAHCDVLADLEARGAARTAPNS